MAYHVTVYIRGPTGLDWQVWRGLQQQFRDFWGEVDFFVFISEQWLLVSLLVALIYAFAITERIKAGKPASAHEATQLINIHDAKVIDLRDRSEFTAGHIVDAIHIPHGEMEKRIGELAPYKEKTLILADKMGQHAGLSVAS